MTDIPSRSLRVFLCHSPADKPAVRELYQRLHDDVFEPWLDEEDLLPGQDLQLEIPKAVRNSDVVIVCLSRNAISKEGYVQKDLRDALDVADEKPEGTILLIPLKLERCEVPERLTRWHWVDHFDPNGYVRLIKALRARANSLSATTSSPQSKTDAASQTSRYAVTLRARPDGPPSGIVGDQKTGKAPGKSVPANDATAANTAPANGTLATGASAVPARPLFPHVITRYHPWECPAVKDIFESSGYGVLSVDDLREKAYIIEETLRAFGVEGKVIEVNRGPTITQFGVEPGFVQRGGKMIKMKISQIEALGPDLKLALAAKNIYIEPVPGRNIVGIEVPNDEIIIVTLRDAIESESFQKVKHEGALPIAIGLGVSWHVADFAKLPHLLIVGKTGSGKSMCINAIVSCLIAHFTPNELRLLMIDPKRVELIPYNGVPHLLAPVVVDLEKVTGVLNWVTREMDERYRKFAKSGARSIDDYNTKITEDKAKDGAISESILPYIVVVIDGLTDLMMLAPNETEKIICHLLKNAHASGIHLIITTHVDVVTRSIKSNFPARIAFSLASASDSRIILDTAGAERLLGRGDMLYKASESESPQRLQGCFVSDKEIYRLVRFWKSQRGAETAGLLNLASEPLARPLLRSSFFPYNQPEIEQANAADEDDLLQRAIEVVKSQKKASISQLQRQLRIGYTRAARLIDQLEEQGIIGPAKEDSRWRDLLDNDH